MTGTSLTPPLPDRLANLGRLRFRLHRRLYRRRSSYPSRPPSRSAPNRRLRTRLLRNCPPDLLSRNCRHLLHLRLLRRNVRLPARNQRNARAPRLPQIALPLHGDRHRLLHVLLAGGVSLLRPMGSGAFARISRLNDQDHRLWGWVYRPVSFRVLVLARRREIRLRADFAQLGALAV
jgi:hypothetical protein